MAERETEHRNVVLVPQDAAPKTKKNYETVNGALLGYSGRFNDEYIKMSKEADNLKASANNVNMQAAKFNVTLYQIEVDLQSIIDFLAANPTYGS